MEKHEKRETLKRPVKIHGYSNKKSKEKRARKRAEANARQEAHNLLSTKEKITKAKSRRGESKVELSGLTGYEQRTKETTKS